MTHLVQVSNKPHYVLVFQIGDYVLIFISVKDVEELLVKPGRSPVKIVELP